MTRLPTRIGAAPARAAALLLLALPGTAFLYQGEELGLEEVALPDELRQDPIFARTNGARKGRDGCRVPVPWGGELPGHGFTSETPWLPIPDAWGARSVAAQTGDPSSVLELHRRALRIRRAGDALRTGSFRWVESPAGTIAFERAAGGEVVTCIVNFDGDPFELDKAPLLASEPLDGRLPAGAAAWLR